MTFHADGALLISSSLAMSYGTIQSTGAWIPFQNGDPRFCSLWKFSSGSPQPLDCNDQWNLLSLIHVHLSAPMAHKEHGPWIAKLFKNCHYTAFTNGQGAAQFIYCYAMPAAYQSRITAVQRQPHHRQPWNATLPVSASLICLAYHQRVLTSTAASPYMLSKRLWIHTGFSPSAAQYSSTFQCFKCPSISVILESAVVFPPIKWNSCDYQKIIMNVQGLQLCSGYYHKKIDKNAKHFFSLALTCWSISTDSLLDVLTTMLCTE